jgi:hypothetical protein
MYKRDDTTLRLRAGYNSLTSDFVFELYDALGNPTVTLNSTGQVIVTGDIQTETDAYIGKRLVLGADIANLPYVDFVPNPWYSSVTKGLFIAEDGSTDFLMALVGTTGWLTNEQVVLYTKSDLTIEVPLRLEISNYNNDSVSQYASADQIIKLQSYGHRIHIGSGDEMGFYSTESLSGYRKGVHIGDAFCNVFISNGVNLEESYSSERAIPVRHHEYDMQMDMDYWWGRNQKYIGHISATATPHNANATVSASTNQISSTTPGRIVCATTHNNTQRGAQETLAASLNLTTFTDGSAVNTSDAKLVALVYISDFNAIYATGDILRIDIGASSNAYFRFYKTKADLNGSGWNLVEWPLSERVIVAGSPNLNNIQFIRGLWTSIANQGGKYCQVDYLAVVRQSPQSSSDYQTYGSFNHFQKSYDGDATWFNNVSFAPISYRLKASTSFATPWNYSFTWMDDTGYFGGRVLMSPNGNNPNLILAATGTAGTLDMGFKAMNYFVFEVAYEALLEDSSPMLTWWCDDDNHLYAEIYGGALALYGYINGVSFSQSRSVEYFPRFYDCTITLIRSPNGEVRAQFKHDASISNYATVNYKGPAENQSGVYGVQDCYGFEGRLYISSPWFGENHRIKSVKIKPYNSDFWPKVHTA